MTSNQTEAWNAALFVIQALRDAGHAAVLAGGCVRDRLLGRTPKDYDVATDAPPHRVREVFPKARLVGAKFGVALVRKYGHDVEVATFRSDGVYRDGRHPDNVTFGGEIDDARRRDFTINGLFFDPGTNQVIDHVGGRDDLAAGVIRTIGDPESRFSEDHLRMLRAVRLAARLNFVVEPATANAIRRLASHLPAISPERIWMELEQILTESTRMVGWSLLRSLELRGQLSPAWQVNPRQDELVGRRLAGLPAQIIDHALALAAALPDAEDGTVLKVCRSFRLSNRLTARTRWLVRGLNHIGDADSLELADFKILLANEDWELLLDLLKADLFAHDCSDEPLCRARDRAAGIARDDITPPPLLDGDEIIALNIPPGPALGRVMRDLYRAQLNESIRTRSEAELFVRERARLPK